jgi:hypothetical protein
MTLRQRRPRLRDQKHTDYINKLPCCICGSTRNVEAAHLKLRLPEIGKEMPGMQMKADDSFVTPLCHYHHQSGILAQHRVGEQRFWFEIHGRNPFDIAASLWIESGGAARALEPKPVKRARKVAARKPPEQRTRIQSRSEFTQGRKLQSRGFENKRTGFKKSFATQGVRA